MMFIDLEQRNYTILLLEKEKCVHFLIDYFLNMVYQYRDEDLLRVKINDAIARSDLLDLDWRRDYGEI